MEDNELKKILLKEKKLQEIKNYKENEINWINDSFFNSWEKISGKMKKIFGNKKEYFNISPKWIFLSHSEDTIKGKPQLIENVKKKIPLVRLAIKKVKDEETKEIKEIQSFYFIGENFDKRHDGFQRDVFALDFWMYKIVDESGKEYFILSQEKFPNETCIFKGMTIELDDFAEISRSMKIKSLSRIFFVKEFEPSVKIISKEQIVKYTKEKNIDEYYWLNFLAYHPWGTLNRFPYESEMLKSAFILSGKKEDYPLHLVVLGTAGTKKSCGYIETTGFKFSEETKIIEGGNSRIKGLSPSFKEKPASIGYLAECERIGFIDELGKMIDFELLRHDSNNGNILGELNFLLDHKVRTVSSGNDNGCQVQANSKFLFTMNPCSGRKNIYEHIGIIDPTTMSRTLWWVQDENEQDFAFSDKCIKKLDDFVVFPPTPRQAYKSKNCCLNNKINKNDDYVCVSVRGEIDNKVRTIPLLKGIETRDDFLTLFDTINSFVCDLDKQRINKISNFITILAKEPMKSSVWKPRAEHHVFLLTDGLVKHRCLFKDYDDTFTPKEEDYELAEAILTKMVRAWDTSLEPKRKLTIQEEEWNKKYQLN